MATRKGKEKVLKKPATKRAPQRSTAKAHPTLGAKPLSRKAKTIIYIDEQEKENPARDPTRFPNRFSELIFPTMVERNYHSEHLLAPPDHIVQYVMSRIERRQREFLMWRQQEANLSWEVEFYSNYHSPSLQSVYVRRKQVPVSEEAIQRVLNVSQE
ncbi:hypothetical protein AHAS_Ahas20G0208900 [Arachis hypogaea]